MSADAALVRSDSPNLSIASAPALYRIPTKRESASSDANDAHCDANVESGHAHGAQSFALGVNTKDANDDAKRRDERTGQDRPKLPTVDEVYLFRHERL